MNYLIPIFLFLVGVCAGIVGSFLGIGGGIIVLPSLVFLSHFKLATAITCTVVIVFLNGLVSGIMHLLYRNFKFEVFKRITWIGILGSVVGSYLFYMLGRFTHILSIILGTYFMYVSVKFAIDAIHGYNITRAFRGSKVIYISGFIAGFMVGLLGLGSGSILVPLLIYALNLPVKIAVGTSLLCFTPMALISVVLKVIHGGVDVLPIVLIFPGLLIGARLGSKLLVKTPVRIVKAVFSIAFLLIGIKFVLSSIM